MSQEIGLDSVVLPGDVINIAALHVSKAASKAKIILGPGLNGYGQTIQTDVSGGSEKEGTDVVVLKGGILRFRSPNVYLVDSCETSYTPARSDAVIGVVVSKAGDQYMVDIGMGGGTPATLSYLSFENATKRFRPNVKVNDVVYAKVLEASRFLDPEIVCVDGKGKSSGMGVLKEGGFMFTTSVHFARRLLGPAAGMLKRLGKVIPYEITIGMNGRIWVKGRSVEETILLVNSIDSLQHCGSQKEWKQLFEERLNRLQSTRH